MLRKAMIVAASALALAACAVLSGVQDEVIAGFCSAHDARPWTRIDAPADADAYRRIAEADPSLSRWRPPGDEYWFALPTGEVKYCLTPLRRGSTVPERNGAGCDDRIGTWWEFTHTETGPTTRGAEDRICVL